MKFSLAIIFLAASVTPQQIVLEPVVTHLSSPLGFVAAPDGRMFIVQQGGRIVLQSGATFLDISSLISTGNERGLLGLAFDPNFLANGFFFVDYTDRNGNVTISRYKASGNAADPSSGSVVMTIGHEQFANHNGGQLQFGPDGYLYIGVGDGGGAGDQLNTAPDRSKLLGKILRIDVSSLPYRIPSSNPFGTEVWAYGLRNPWRFSFDRLTNDLLIGDVGQDRWEEVDVQPATSKGGENYAWHCFEATHPYRTNGPECQNQTFTMPVLEYPHTDGACSITGGYRYEGSRYPRMRGIYFYGDFCNGVISGATQQANGTWTSQTLLHSHLNISSFGQDSNGELYVVDLNGAIYHIADASAPLARRRAATH